MTVHEEDYNGYILEIVPDECSESPREWDNLWSFHFKHRRYDLACEVMEGHDGDLGELKQKLLDAGALRVEVIYMYDHSGVVLGRSKTCRWDSGVVGVAALMPERIEVCGTTEEHWDSCLDGELDTYTKYLNGDTYGFIIKNGAGEEVDSCYGYYGTDDCISEAKAVIDSLVKIDEQKAGELGTAEQLDMFAA